MVKKIREQIALPEMEYKIARSKNGQANKLDQDDRAFHDWYRFVLSFPPHLVQDYIKRFGLDGKSIILDPFCGTGTTLVESKRCGLTAIGVEANPFAHFASTVKVDWGINPDTLMKRAREIASSTRSILKKQGIDDVAVRGQRSKIVELRVLEPQAAKLLLADSISPIPLHKILVLRDQVRKYKTERFYGHMVLALANTLVFKASNLRFGPEVGVGKLKSDVPVLSF